MGTIKRGETLMKWQAEQKGYTCNDCYLSMQNCHDKSICCEDETGLCDYFEEMPQGDTIRRQDAIDAALTFIVEYCGAAFDEEMQKRMFERLNDLPSAEPKHGKWLHGTEKILWDETDDGPEYVYGTTWTCSECGYRRFMNSCPDDKFCKECGAKMSD